MGSGLNSKNEETKCSMCKARKATIHLDQDYCFECFKLYALKTSDEKFSDSIKSFEIEDLVYHIEKEAYKKALRLVGKNKSYNNKWSPTKAWIYNQKGEWINVFKKENGDFGIRNKGGVHVSDYTIKESEMRRWYKLLGDELGYKSVKFKKGARRIWVP